MLWLPENALVIPFFFSSNLLIMLTIEAKKALLYVGMPYQSAIFFFPQKSLAGEILIFFSFAVRSDLVNLMCKVVLFCNLHGYSIPSECNSVRYGFFVLNMES